MSNKIFGFAEAHIQRSQPSLTQLRQPHAPKHPSVFLTVLGELHQSKLFELQYACINIPIRLKQVAQLLREGGGHGRHRPA
jgi:hypothetical protein